MTGRLRMTLTLVLSLGAGSAYALAAADAGEAGWAPLVMMLGDGDREASLAALRGLSHAYAAALHRTEIDEATQRFHDGVLEDFADFDLGGMRALRRLRRARRSDKRATCPRSAPFARSARQLPGQDGRRHGE